jgi:predicted ATPase
MVLGAQGIGKSALIEEFLRGLDPRHVRIVRGIARPYDRDIPLGSMASLIANVLRLGEQDDLRQVRDTLATRVNALFPDEPSDERDLLMQSIGAVFSIRFPDSRFDELTGDERRDRTFLSLTKLVVRFAEKKPMVLAIDDAHYIDSLTLEFAREFLGATRGAPAYIIMTADAAGPHVDTPEWRGLLDASHVEVVHLDDLTNREAESLVRELLRLHRIDDESLVSDILHQSGGNPLYVREVVEVLRDRGMLKDTGERRSLQIDQASKNYLPSSVEGLIGSRIDRLPLAQKSILQRVAFLWTPFTGEDVRLILPDEPFDELEDLVEQGLLERADIGQGAQHDTFDPFQKPPAERKYQFCNALTQEVAARGLVPEEAREVHRQLADHLMQLESEHRTMTSALIAHHFDGAGEQDRSVEFYSEAAVRALEQFGASEALRLAEKVLKRVEPDSDYRYRALELKAKALLEIGNRAGAQEALEALEDMARKRDEPLQVAEVALQQARFWFEQSELRKAKDYVAEAREIAEAEDAAQTLGKTWLQDAIIRLTEGRREEAVELTEQAIEVFSEDDASAEDYVRARNLRGVIRRQTGLHDQALADYEEALEHATKHELRKWRRYLLTNTGLALAYLGKFQQALDRYEEALAEARELGHRTEEANLLVNIGHAHVLRGDLEEAFTCLRRGNYLARKVNASQILADGLISLGACYLEQGEHDKAQDTLQEGLRMADSIPNVYLSVHATLLMARGNLNDGTADGARVALMQAEDALERAERADMRWGEAYGSMLMARAYRILGKRDRALELSERAMELVDQGELYAIEEILYHHAQLLPDDDEHANDRKQALRRAREVVMHRRDLIQDEAARKQYMNKSLNRQIVTASGLMLDD